MAQESDAPKPSTSIPGKAPINFLDLPAETIHLILEFVPYHDLCQLCRVSQAAREFAAAELYRTFNHTFRVDHPRRSGLDIDDLAGYLETLATSEYNYAAHIKEAYFDTAFAGDSGEKACREFSYEHSCGKFLQTLLLAVLKRTKGVEDFHWNTRIELSSAVYRTLHQMPNLRKLHVRLQAGPSLHSTSNNSSSVMNIPASSPTIVTAPPMGPPPPQQGHHGYNQFPPHSSASNVQIVKKAPVARQVLRPTTFSKFKGLTSLAVLDMDTLENVPEIAECIGNCTESLKHLQLSISEKFARKARIISTTNSVSDNTVTDDDASDINVAPPAPLNIDGSENVAGTQLPETTQSYRLAQENALGRIFSFPKTGAESKELRKATDDVIARAEKELDLQVRLASRDKEDKQFVRLIKSIIQGRNNSNPDAPPLTHEKRYEKLEKAAAEYLESRELSGSLAKYKPKKPKKLKKVPVQNNFPPPPHNLQPPAHLQPSKPGNVYSFLPIPMLSSVSGASSSQNSQTSSAYSGFGPSSYPPPPNPNPQSSYHPFSNSDEFPYQIVANGPQYNIPMNAPGPSGLSGIPGKPFPVPMPISGPIFPINHSGGKSWKKVVSKKKPASSKSRSVDSKSDTHKGPIVISVETTKPEIYDDDVDLEHPDVEDEQQGEDQKFGSDEESTDAGSETQVVNTAVNGTPTGLEQASLDNDLATSVHAKGKGAVRDPPNGHLDSPRIEAPGKTPALLPLPEETQSYAAAYLRLSHGLPLESLAIYLLPVKPSVLLRHIDVHSLKSLCLLNVGPQRTLWATLTKLHRQSPLNLSSVFTDNTTQSLLTFLNLLPAGQLSELALFEHGPRAKVPQLTGCTKTIVDISEIRKKVLKKHMHGLKRLVLRNDDDTKWLVESTTVRLIINEGKNLKELAVQCYSQYFHTLIRALPSLPRLYALQATFVVDTPQPSVAMNSSHPSPIQPNYANALPPVITGTILEECRQCIVDCIKRSEGIGADGTRLDLTFFGLAIVNGKAQPGFGLGPPGVVISRVGWMWESITDLDESGGDSSTDDEQDEGDESSDKDSSDEKESTPKKQKAEKKEEATEKQKPPGSEDKEKRKEFVVWTADSLSMENIWPFVKMWGKEFWAGRL